MFYRVILYNNLGNILVNISVNGNIKSRSTEKIAFDNGIESYFSMRWDSPDATIEEKFADPYNNDIRIDVTKNPHEIIFGHIDKQEEEQPPSYTDLLAYYNAMKEAVE